MLFRSRTHARTHTHTHARLYQILTGPRSHPLVDDSREYTDHIPQRCPPLSQSARANVRILGIYDQNSTPDAGNRRDLSGSQVSVVI